MAASDYSADEQIALRNGQAKRVTRVFHIRRLRGMTFLPGSAKALRAFRTALRVVVSGSVVWLTTTGIALAETGQAEQAEALAGIADDRLLWLEQLMGTRWGQYGLILFFFALIIGYLRVLFGPRGMFRERKWDEWNEEARRRAVDEQAARQAIQAARQAESQADPGVEYQPNRRAEQQVTHEAGQEATLHVTRQTASPLEEKEE